MRGGRSVRGRGAATLPDRSVAQAFLQDPGYAVVPLSAQITATLTTALKAFHGQLNSWGQHPPQGVAGFKSFPLKNRLEFRPGHAAFGDVGVLQQMAVEPHWRGATLPPSLEAIQYPALDASARLAAQSPSCEAHVDRGLLTCIFADSSQGLQVQQANGLWDVTLPARHVIMLPGYTLERATCGLVKATTHRVVIKSSAASCARNALVYKLRAPDSAVLDLYPHLSLRHANSIPARFRGPVAVGELMHFFDATHESINNVYTSRVTSRVMETSAAPSSRNALVYKLRARECAILNLYPHLSPDTPFLQVSIGRCRFRGPIAVSELMHFFNATHESINDPSRADRLESASFGRPFKRARTEAAIVIPVLPIPQARIQHAQQNQVQGIQFVVRSQDGSELQFRVLPTTLLHKVFCAYASKRSLELDNLVFIFEGIKLRADRTVQESEIEDGDIIDLLSSMVGD